MELLLAAVVAKKVLGLDVARPRRLLRKGPGIDSVDTGSGGPAVSSCG